MKTKRKPKYSDGWTFVETLIVMAIVLILTAAVGFSATKQLDKAKIVTARSQLETFSLALDSYYMDVGDYPSQEDGLDALWQKPGSANDENGLPYGICSYGKDGMEGRASVRQPVPVC